MLNKYQVNIIEGMAGKDRFAVYADTIDAAAIRAGYELQQEQAAEEIRILSNYAFISWADSGILCEIVQENEW